MLVNHLKILCCANDRRFYTYDCCVVSIRRLLSVNTTSSSSSLVIACLRAEYIRDEAKTMYMRSNQVSFTQLKDIYVSVRLSLLRKTILIPEYLAFMCSLMAV